MLLTYMCVPKHMCIEMKMITFCAFLCAFMRYDTNIENHDKYIQRLNLKLVKYILENKLVSCIFILIK